MKPRARLEQLTVLAIAEEPRLQAALRAELGALVRELRVVATSQLARKVLQGWRPSVVVWRIVVPKLEDISLAREIRHSTVDPPHIVYLHRDGDVVLLPAELELLFA